METEITIQDPHPGQLEIYRNATRYNVVRCGRRWGKTKQMVMMAAQSAIGRKGRYTGGPAGLKVGLFTPEHKQLNEPYDELLGILHPLKQKANKNEGTIRLKTGGLIDFWSLNDNELAGRGREYDLVMIDEGAFTKTPQMVSIWEKSIRPTMLTRPGSRAWVFSTPNGNDPENFFWRLCHEEKWGFKEHYAPTSSNPFVPPEELENERKNNDPRVFRQEFLAEFVDWSGDALFDEQNLLVDGLPVEYPKFCDYVYAVIDTAVKDGQAHDGTAVSYWAAGTRVNPTTWHGHPLVCLDWDYVQIEGAMLEKWIPAVYARLEELALQCGARAGSIGVYIEDAQSGSILLQQLKHRKLPARPLPQVLTSAGKDARAINASGPVYQGRVKYSDHAFRKGLSFKGAYRNHLTAQINGFRIGDKDASKRADDLLDTFTYSVAITLGNNKGHA